MFATLLTLFGLDLTFCITLSCVTVTGMFAMAMLYIHHALKLVLQLTLAEYLISDLTLKFS